MDDFAPFGYLDNPWHSAILSASGVVRTVPTVGFAWHFPSYAGPYARQHVYRAALRLALLQEDAVLFENADFASAGISLISRSHSKNTMSFDWSLPPLSFSAAYFLAGADSLCCLLSIQNGGPAPATVPLAIVGEYERQIGASRAWDLGVLARCSEAEQAIVLLAYPEGEAFALLSQPPASLRCAAASSEELRAVLAGYRAPSGLAVAPAPTAHAFGALVHRIPVAPGERRQLLAVLGRGVNERQARSAATLGLRDGRPVLSRLSAEDALFRAGSPSLTGDWPVHWRRGLIYDADTLRAVTRRPQGIYRAHWDGMQIQSPRAVLAEAALDALLLSYSAPGLAKEIILGTFADAPAANLPCTREDGSYNMIAEDGEPCGTAPEWCFPVHCVDLIFRRTGDLAWLHKIYPRLSRYLRWWLRNRSDRDGWLHYHCSWESGQDDSPRFGLQRSGGSVISHVRPVDLQAAMAQAGQTMARLSRALDRRRAAVYWRRVAEAYLAKTQSLWHDEWFHDFDAREGSPTNVRDVMHLAPLLAGVTAEQRALLRPAYDSLPPHGIWPPLDWPPVVFTAVEAAAAAGWHDLAGSIAASLADRVYRAYDARRHTADGPLPGTASERWATAGSWGAEGYGWGALGTLLVLRHVVGWQEGESGEVILHPSLPPSWLEPGRQFVVAPLHHRGGDLLLRYASAGSGALEITVGALRGPSPCRVDAVGGEPLAVSAPLGLHWKGRNGEAYRIAFEG